jgi:hypothetical protein
MSGWAWRTSAVWDRIDLVDEVHGLGDNRRWCWGLGGMIARTWALSDHAGDLAWLASRGGRRSDRSTQREPVRLRVLEGVRRQVSVSGQGQKFLEGFSHQFVCGYFSASPSQTGHRGNSSASLSHRVVSGWSGDRKAADCGQNRVEGDVSKAQLIGMWSKSSTEFEADGGS